MTIQLQTIELGKMPPKDEDLAYVQDVLGADLDTLLVYSLLRTEHQLAPFIDTALRSQSLTPAQFNALLALRAAGGDGLLMSELGQRLVVTKSNVTGLVDRLEAQNLVARADLPDRRATAVRLTQAGHDLLDKVVPTQARLLADLSSSLTNDEKKTLVRLHYKLRCALKERPRT